MEKSRLLCTVCAGAAVMFVCMPSYTAEINVFFAGGQSNAKSVWVDSIRQALTRSGVYDQVLVVGDNREGAWLRHWYGGPTIGPTEGYLSDFFNDEGTGNLQVAINSIVSAEDTARFEGLFWMQGESDSLLPETIAVYDDHFHAFLNHLSADLGGPLGTQIFNVAIGAIAVNPSVPFPLADTYPNHDPELMRAVQFRMAAADPGMSINDTQGLARYDYWHMTAKALEDLGADMVASFLLLPAPIPSTLVDLSGTIKTVGGNDICAMVLASGQFMFSCNSVGVFSLTDLPREYGGTVQLQIYADGFFPEIDVLTGSSSEAVVMTRSGTCPSYNTPYDPGVLPDSAGKRIDISGSVLLKNTQTPICAIALANGQYMFSCDGTGSYALNIPLDNNGQFKLQVYADGFAPTTQTFDEFQTINEVRMAPAVECQ